MSNILPPHIDSQVKQAIIQLFPKYDKNKNDKLSADEIKGFMNEALEMFGLTVDVSMKQIQQTILKVFDKNWDQMLSRQQMYGCLKHIVSLQLGGRHYFEEQANQEYVPLISSKPQVSVKASIQVPPVSQSQKQKVVRHFSEQQMDNILKDKDEKKEEKKEENNDKVNIRMVSSAYGSQQNDIIESSPVIQPRYRVSDSLFNSSMQFKANKPQIRDSEEQSPIALKKDTFGLINSNYGGLLPSPSLGSSYIVEQNVMKKSQLDFQI